MLYEVITRLGAIGQDALVKAQERGQSFLAHVAFELRAFPPALRTVPHALRGVSCALRTVSRPFTSVLSVATGCCLISRKILMGLLGGSLVFIIINLFRQQIDGLHRGVPLFLLLV